MSRFSLSLCRTLELWSSGDVRISFPRYRKVAHCLLVWVHIIFQYSVKYCHYQCRYQFSKKHIDNTSSFIHRNQLRSETLRVTFARNIKTKIHDDKARLYQFAGRQEDLSSEYSVLQPGMFHCRRLSVIRGDHHAPSTGCQDPGATAPATFSRSSYDW